MVKKEKVPLGTFTKEEDVQLINELDKYIEEANKYRPKGTKISRLSFFSNCIKEKLEGKVLTNDLIKLDKPFYFNWLELKENSLVKASTEEPISDLDLTFIVNKVPNNLDVWNRTEETYSSGNSSSVHKGIYVLYWIIYNSKNYFEVRKIVEKYLIFKYNSSDNSLDISLVKEKDLYLYVPSGSSILSELEEEKDNFYNNIVNEGNIINLEEWFKHLEVIKPFKMVKELSVFSTSDKFKELSERLDNAEKVLYTNEEGLTEEGYVLATKDVEDFYNFLLSKALINVELEED